MGAYLVTGAAGFIGSAVAQRLKDAGHEVWTIDNLSTGYEQNVPDGVTFIKGDCQDPEAIKELGGKRFDAILHIAGQSSGEISFDNPVYDLRTNTESTLRLIKYGLETGCQRHVYASTMSVYGAVEDRAIAESYVPRPLSFYGVGKLASENYLRIYESQGLKPTALRLFNVYGPNQNMKNLRQGMVSIFLAQLIKNSKVEVKGPLHRYRDFIYIDDVVHFMLSIVDDERSIGGVYNVGTGVKTTVGDLLKEMMRVANVDKSIDILPRTPGDQDGVYADMSLVESTFGFKASTDIQSGLKKMVEWAIENKW